MEEFFLRVLGFLFDVLCELVWHGVLHSLSKRGSLQWKAMQWMTNEKPLGLSATAKGLEAN